MLIPYLSSFLLSSLQRLKPASSIKVQFLVKSRSESFHSINDAYFVCRFSIEFLTSGSNVGFFTVMGIVSHMGIHMRF